MHMCWKPVFKIGFSESMALKMVKISSEMMTDGYCQQPISCSCGKTSVSSERMRCPTVWLICTVIVPNQKILSTQFNILLLFLIRNENLNTQLNEKCVRTLPNEWKNQLGYCTLRMLLAYTVLRWMSEKWKSFKNRIFKQKTFLKQCKFIFC